MKRKSYFLLYFMLIPLLLSAQQKPQKHVVNKKLLEQWEKERAVKAEKKRLLIMKVLPTLNPDSVTELDLSDMGLFEIPDIKRFYRLQKINLADNHLQRIRKKDLPFYSLKTLILTGNPIIRINFDKGLPVEKLVLNRCGLRRVPYKVRRLKNLHEIQLMHNLIKRVPVTFKKFPLREVNLNYNRFKFNRRSVKRLAHVEKVLIGGNGLHQLPDNIGLMQVKRLNLGKNHLSSVPTSFADLTHLETIIFYKNGFSSIPDEIFRLPQLKEIDFYYNKLTAIPDEIGRLKQLKRIYLSFNQIDQLPSTMQHLSNLQFLYVHNNRLRIIPNWITKLDRLTILDAGFNELIAVPDLSVIQSLQEVDLQHNNLEEIPWRLLEKPNLKMLFLRGNPFIRDPDDLRAIRRISQKRQQEGVVIYYD